MSIRPAVPTIQKLMCANRGEIAIRVFRAATELGLRTVAIYSHADRVHLHRYKADESYMVGQGVSPVAAYLDVERVVRVACEAGVDAIHPGYGFLSESAELAEACQQAGIRFVGPRAEQLRRFGDKTAARALAIEAGVPVVPGSDGPVSTLEEARAFVQRAGLPCILKAAMGGGGRGMRVVRAESELADAFERASSEALSAFGNGTLFIERFVERPRHIEVQILADAGGEVVHLFERDCSVQRRHQKVVEAAPAAALDGALRDRLTSDAVKLARHAGYLNAGTVEFLVGPDGNYYFIEVNPRIQVEHTVTEEVTGVDLVQSQIRIAGGASLSELGLLQERIRLHGTAVQCRITTEDPKLAFQPDTGRLEVFRSAGGMGIRLDGGSGYTGAVITPDYDSLLVKVTARASERSEALRKLERAIREFRIRGVSTNIPFLLNVLQHPRFQAGQVDTGFVDDSPELLQFPRRHNRAQRLLRYLADLVVNGSGVQSMSGARPAEVIPPVPDIGQQKAPGGWRDCLRERGPEGFAAAVRGHRALLVTDTTWRDAHQSLLATRVRTRDLEDIAPATAHHMAGAYSLEMWGGATFDVALRFLHECPWDRLDRLRDKVPNVPFQMLLRGASAVGYSNYPDNVVKRFVATAHAHGVDIFRVFDALNYLENMRFGIDAVGEAGGVIEAAICYTGDVAAPGPRKYSLDYYVDLAGRLHALGIHVLAIKDMAGLLKPRAATLLVGKLRESFPDLPIHVHTHDTAGTGVTSMLACAEAGADVIDAALPAMAGLTSQPTVAAIAAALEGSDRAVELKSTGIQELNGYWEACRGLYAPFESGLSGYAPDLYQHEIPGGQYTNLRFQAFSLGLADRWDSIKRNYAAANRLLGDLIKVTPTSKVVGDLAQFMVQNDLDEATVQERAGELDFPKSVVDFLSGRLGQPHGGFPEPLRSRALRGRPIVEGRPGESLPDVDFDALRDQLVTRHGNHIREVDVISAALYPAVFREYRDYREIYGDVSVLPTRAFLEPLKEGSELTFEIQKGKRLVVVLTAVGEVDPEGQRRVFFELNGQPRAVSVRDKSIEAPAAERERADAKNPRSIGAPMPGSVIDCRIRQGERVEKGEPLVVLSAMKMETVVASPEAGTVQRLAVKEGDSLKAGDLIALLD